MAESLYSIPVGNGKNIQSEGKFFIENKKVRGAGINLRGTLPIIYNRSDNMSLTFTWNDKPAN